MLESEPIYNCYLFDFGIYFVWNPSLADKCNTFTTIRSSVMNRMNRVKHAGSIRLFSLTDYCSAANCRTGPNNACAAVRILTFRPDEYIR